MIHDMDNTRIGKMHVGGCLCKAVRYQISEPLDELLGCHCGQCRRWTSSYVVATRCPDEAFEFVSSETLKWVKVSETAKRGFCSHCGTSLFWKRDNSAMISVMASSFDDDVSVKMKAHIFAADASEFYEITGDVPVYDTTD